MSPFSVFRKNFSLIINIKYIFVNIEKIFHQEKIPAVEIIFLEQKT
jgi:hypothetical protein